MTRRSEVLSLALAGLSDFEIASLLGIGKRRVRDLIRSARAAGVDVPRAADRRSIALDNPRNGSPQGHNDGTHDSGDPDD